MMNLLLGLCQLFLSRFRQQHDWLHRDGKCLFARVSLISCFSFPFNSSNFPFTFPFLFFLSLWFYLPHNSALWAQLHIPLAFQSGAKNNHLFFYSHWLCYNAATLCGQTRGQSIISPLSTQAAVWLFNAKHRDKPHLPHSGIQSSNVFSISMSFFKGKHFHKCYFGKKNICFIHSGSLVALSFSTFNIFCIIWMENNLITCKISSMAHSVYIQSRNFLFVHYLMTTMHIIYALYVANQLIH